jgi:dienelactone hydrolase
MLTLLLALFITPDEAMTRAAEAKWRLREQRVAALRTNADVKAYSERVRDKLLAAMGGLPQTRAPLNARVTGGFEMDEYRVEKVLFESQPGFFVTGNLYLPKSHAMPYPAVLGVAGHSENGKAYKEYQRAWIGFAKRGYAVFAIDPAGQGERLEYRDPATGRSKVGIGVNEHIAAGLQCLLTGTSFARYEVWDGIRAVDYLLTRPEIDPKRIAVAGNSGGGTQASYLSVFEPRLAAAVASCYITRWRELWPGPGPQDAEQVFPRFISSELDFADFALANAPKPFLITAATRDFFPIAGTRATAAELERLYGVLDAPGRFAVTENDDVHGWARPQRESAVRFLARQFGSGSEEYAEPEIEPAADDRLCAAPQCQVSNIPGSTTVREINLDLAKRMHASRRAAGMRTPGELRGLLLERLRIDDAELRDSSDVLARARAVKPPSGTGPWPAVIAFGDGIDAEAIARGGKLVIEIEPRGFEKSRASKGSGYSPSYQFAARAWMLGTHVPALAVADVRAAAELALRREDVRKEGITVLAKGAARTIAWLAAAADPRIGAAVLDRDPTPYLEYAAAELHQDLERLAIPGVLADFDLPDLAPLVPRR